MLAVSVTAMVFVFMHLDSSVLEWNYLSMALRGSGIFLPLTFCIFFPGRVRASMGVAAMGAGIFAALFWKHISPWEINSLLPALVYNLFFLLIGLAWGKKGNRSEKAAFTASGLLAKSSVICYIIDKGQPPTSVGCQSFYCGRTALSLGKD